MSCLTKSCVNGEASSTTCESWRRLAGLDDYFRSPPGISRRIDSLAQDFSFKVVNNASKVCGQANGAKWIRWDATHDERMCDRCGKYSRGGRKGFYHVSWFMPTIPAHPNCRCMLVVYFYTPEVVK